MNQLDDATIDQAILIFKKLPQNEQGVTLYEMLRYIRGEIAIVKKKQVEIENDLRNAKLYNEDRRDTNEKIRVALEKRFDAFTWFRDKVLPNIILLICYAILRLTWGAPLP